MSKTNKLGWDFIKPDGEELVWMANVGIPEIRCGICGYDFRRNKYPFRADCPSCEAHKITSPNSSCRIFEEECESISR